MQTTNKPSTLGIIIGNRDFFPDKLVAAARTEVLDLFKKLNISPILLSDADSKLGGVETLARHKNVQRFSKNMQQKLMGFLLYFPTSAMKKALLKQ
jgi:L-fucose isomerase-like protein